MLGGMYGGMGMGGLGGMGGYGMSGYGMGGMGMGGYGSGMGMGGYGMSSGLGGMYGGSSGMYGSGYGNGGMGMTGMNMNGAPSGGLMGGNSNAGLIGGGDGTGAGGLGGPQPQGGSLLPADPNAPASPINQHGSPLPPLNESVEERGRRVRAEHRKERQLIKQQREQRKQIRMQARMEIAGHLTNVLVQTLRSTMEMFAVCFGTYYSMKAVRAFANSQEAMSQNMNQQQFRRGPMGQMIPVANTAAAASAKTTTAVAAVGEAASAKPSRWKVWLLFGALFILGEVAYTAISRARQNNKAKQMRSRRRSRVTEDEYGNIITHDEMETDSAESAGAMSLYTTDSDAMASVYRSNTVAANGGADGSLGHSRGGRDPSAKKRLFVAAYDHVAEQAEGDYLSFKAGDEFIVEDYVEGSWCEAVPVSGSKENGGYAPTATRGLVPSNFLRPLENAMKL